MAAKIVVTLAGLGLMVLLDWYFFPRRRPTRSKS